MDAASPWYITLLAISNSITLIYYAFWIIADWRIFEKAGVPGWKALIPVYNVYVQYSLTWNASMAIPTVLLSIAGGIMSQYCTGVWAVLGSCFAIAGGIMNIIGLHKLSVAFGHGKGFTAGLFFLQPIFIMILGFGKDEFQGTRMPLSR